MTVFTKLGNDVFSPVNADGTQRAIVNQDAQVWSTEVERLFSAFQAGGGIVFASVAAMTLTYAANQMAWVIGDPVAVNNGIYQKQGASGSGSWTRLADLPYSFIKATNAGAGAANAIVATSSIPVPAADGGALITVNVTAENTGPATISFNGGAALNIVSSSGNALQAGYLTSGMQLAGFKVGSDFRLLSDVASAAIVAAAEAHADRAETAAAAALAAMPNSFPASRAVLAGLDTATITSAFLKEAGREGQFVWLAGDQSARVTSDPQQGLYVPPASDTTGASGVWVRVIDRDQPDLSWFGVLADSTIGTDGTDNTATISGAISALYAAGWRGRLFIPQWARFNLKSVCAAVDAAPGIAIFQPHSINWQYSPSYKQKVDFSYSGDRTNDDTLQMIASGHHPAIMLNNTGGAGTGSGADRYTTIMHGAGIDPFGKYLTALYRQVGGVGGKWRYSTILQNPFDVATKVKLWAASALVTAGDILITSPALNVYEVLTTGQVSGTAPTHTSGDVASGTTTLRYRQTGLGLQQTLWYLDEDGNTFQGKVTASTVKHTMRAKNFSPDIVSDGDNNTLSLVVPTNGRVNLGKSGAGASTVVPGFSLTNGSGDNFQFTVTNGLASGVAAIISNTNAGNHTALRFYTAGTQIGSVTCTTTGTAFNVSSDYRLKYDDEPLVEFSLTPEQVAALPASLQTIMKLRPVRHKWRSLPDDQPWSIGQLAHEAAAATPYAVTGEKDAMEDIGTAIIPAHVIQDENGKDVDVAEKRFEGIPEGEAPEGSTWTKTGERPDYQQLDVSKQVHELIAAVQDLTLMNLELRKKLDAMEGAQSV